ncbi:MAG: RecQ family ATP-dependent DNA helicase [Eubacterium sp.]|nr:RecQ family ATP-dependent DNA helicase [Eubacterium sp.]
MADIVFVDLEVIESNEEIGDMGAVRANIPVKNIDNATEYRGSGTGMLKFKEFCAGASFLCGHNIVSFDSKYMEREGVELDRVKLVDTLLMSPICFPKKPYHRLVKDDKLIEDNENNPLNDAKKCMELYLDEVNEYYKFSDNMRGIYYELLHKDKGFDGFFDSIYSKYELADIGRTIISEFDGRICSNSDVDGLSKDYPVELAYALASISADDKDSIIPAWVKINYPKVNRVLMHLRGRKCREGCAYCNNAFNLKKHLKDKFGYDGFRSFNGENLQEKAVQYAVDGMSLLAIFPTGGGKSITFQLPALIEAENVKGLTVVISPLQSLMKDQVDNLYDKGLADAVTINGMLDPLDRREALDRVENGVASILYIAPESLRSNTIEKLLIRRGVNRFVIDEAHCFSSWGQDFRVDYLYIGDFIAGLEEKTGHKIPVSCFTATAKPKVVSDIKAFFMNKLGVSLELCATNATRQNLHYIVIKKDNDRDKFDELRRWIEAKNCPTIVYVSRTKTAEVIAEKLCESGFDARPYHGQMDSDQKIENQNAFKRGELQIVVATSAFGMGVDKSDVGLVVHYEISDSLENYVQEAGRAGRDERIEAECLVLFNESDLDKHFLLLNQTKLSISEIQEVWTGIKRLCKGRTGMSSTALEIARAAGWNPDSKTGFETKVRSAISALEIAGYVKRGNNSPRVYADSLSVKSVMKAAEVIAKSPVFDKSTMQTAIRIVKYLVPQKYRKIIRGKTVVKDEFGIDVETRVDYIADKLGLEKKVVVDCVNKLKFAGILADNKEMNVYLSDSEISRNGVTKKTSDYIKLERYLANEVTSSEIKKKRYDYRELNENAEKKGITSSISMLKDIVNFWTIKGYIEKPTGEVSRTVLIETKDDSKIIQQRLDNRSMLCEFIDEYFRTKAKTAKESLIDEYKTNSGVKVDFSPIDLLKSFNDIKNQFGFFKIGLSDIEEALLFLSKIGSFRLDGGFLVIYNALKINRLEMDNKIRYKKDDYAKFEEFYKNRTQQIHIVGEYANMMVNDYQSALDFANDYFSMDYNLFLKKYFYGNRLKEIERNITNDKYNKLFSNLTDRQTEIINDDETKNIVVAAGPGSGKTMILVHKMASLLMLEDVKHEQLLMLTFSRNAAMEFKRRLHELIGGGTSFVEIKTFHSYAFDILGKMGSLEKSADVVRRAAEFIENDGVEIDKITKTVLVIDEAQDINDDDFKLIQAIRKRNENMRLIAVGDDDQNIFSFRGSKSAYMKRFLEEDNSKLYQMTDNFRSCPLIVDISNVYAEEMRNRLKDERLVSRKLIDGEVMVVRNESYLEWSLEKVFRNCYRKDKKTAILTTTNAEAYNIQFILTEEGYMPRLIQSGEGFSLYNLEEFRTFYKIVSNNDNAVIDDEMWNKAVTDLKTIYAGSDNLGNIEYILDMFDKTYEKKYSVDFENFLRESSFEDFYKCDEGEVLISTIHKAKGHEFDDVFLVLSDKDYSNEEKKRVLYVGMTRAKEHLYIINRQNSFRSDVVNKMHKSGVKFNHDSEVYAEPQKNMYVLTHKDISLSYSGRCMKGVMTGEIMSGDGLDVKVDAEKNTIYFIKNISGVERIVVESSRSYFDRFKEKILSGYRVVGANVNYVAYWRGKDDMEEYKIVLPRLVFKKVNMEEEIE